MWQALFDSHNDRAFITTMGFDVETFELIVRSGFGTLWLSRPIPRTDVSIHGEPRPGGRFLDAWGALGLVLHYLNSTMLEISLQQIFALIPTTVSRGSTSLASKSSSKRYMYLVRIELFYDTLLAKYSLMEKWDLDDGGKKFQSVLHIKKMQDR